jgi:HEAT repeat protein
MTGKSMTVRAVADTLEEAFAQALGRIPDHADVVEKNELVAPDLKTITVEASDEHAASLRAESRAKSELGDDATVKSLTLTVAGRQGFLGVGKQPNQYEAEILRKALVEVVYRSIPPNVEELKAAGNVEGLLKALGYQEDDAIRRAALTALSEMGHGQDAVRALGNMNDAQALTLLKQALKDSDAKVRVAAIQALGKTEDSSVRRLLLKALKDSDPNVRKTALQSLARTNNARTVKELVMALGDPNWGVRNQAVHSLGTMGASAVKPLIATLEHEDKDVRTLAINALGKIGDARAVKALTGVLDDADPDVRKEVPTALGNIAATARLRKDTTVTMQIANLLVRTLKKGDSATRHETVVALQLLSGQDFGDDVDRWNQWTIEAMANQIVSELGKDQNRSVDSVFRW